MIAVFIDSNNLFSSNSFDFTKIWSHEKLDQYIEVIESADLYEHFKIIIPSIVFSELHRQQTEKYRAKSEEIKKLKFPAWKVEYVLDAQDYKVWIEKKHAQYLEHGKRGMVDCEIAEVPLDCFKDVIDRALEKKAPFEGKDKKSDKGFKDALIWETIIDYKRQHPEENIVWITQDKQCGNDCLKDEYENMFKEEIRICKTKEEFEFLLNEFLREYGLDVKPLVKPKDELLVETYFHHFLSNRAREIASLYDVSIKDDIHFDALVVGIERESDTEYTASAQLQVMLDEDCVWHLALNLDLTFEDDWAYVEYENNRYGIVIREREFLGEDEGVDFDRT